MSSVQCCPSHPKEKKQNDDGIAKGRYVKCTMGKRKNLIETNLWVVSLCSGWSLGATEENLNEREIKVKGTMADSCPCMTKTTTIKKKAKIKIKNKVKGKDFAEFFALSFSHSASLTQT